MPREPLLQRRESLDGENRGSWESSRGGKRRHAGAACAACRPHARISLCSVGLWRVVFLCGSGGAAPLVGEHTSDDMRFFTSFNCEK